MDTYPIRRRNLRYLATELGTASLATRLGYSSSSYLSQMVGPHACRPVTEKTARKVESALGLPRGWLDQEHDLLH